MQRPPTYTGVGSRETLPKQLAIMRRIAQVFAERGYRLRTGDATGGDAAFTAGALSVLDKEKLNDLLHAYVSHDRTVGRKSPPLVSYERRPAADMLDALFKIARKYHPNPNALKGPYPVPRNWAERGSPLGLMARNALQVGGEKLDDLSDFVVMAFKPEHLRRWPTDLGGTGQAFRIAKSKGIPTFDLDMSEKDLLDQLALYKGPHPKQLEKMIEYILRAR